MPSKQENLKPWRNMSKEQLLEFYLVAQTRGLLGDFNKKYFPNDYEEMTKELDEICKQRL